MQTPKRKRYQKDSAPADDIVTLIHLVRQNPALYNYKLSPHQRRRSDVLHGWAHIADQIGNKYTVEECRRKWKNLRDTYHQYRLRKPKLGDGLSKWRYAKDLDFLSTVYQPKLKSHRHRSYVDTSVQENILQGVTVHDDEHEHDMVHSTITLVNDDAETYILHTYDESVTDDVTTIEHHTHDDRNISDIELGQIVGHRSHMEEDMQDIVKHEHVSSLDDDGATGAEVDYEEVCLYEEPPGTAQSVDCETIIEGCVGRSASTDSKTFQYIDTQDFCMIPSGSSNSSIMGNTKLKSLSNVATVVTTAPTITSVVDSGTSSTICSPIMQIQQSQHVQSPDCGQTREELDLFFDFLKKKMQRFSKEEITTIQVEFLKCVLRREAELEQKNNTMH